VSVKHLHYCHPGVHWIPCPQGHTDETQCKLKLHILCEEHRDDKEERPENS
jgi:hypothetical protein